MRLSGATGAGSTVEIPAVVSAHWDRSVTWLFFCAVVVVEDIAVFLLSFSHIDEPELP